MVTFFLQKWIFSLKKKGLTVTIYYKHLVLYINHMYAFRGRGRGRGRGRVVYPSKTVIFRSIL